MGSFEDDAHWNNKYDQAGYCEVHEDEELKRDEFMGDFWCYECEYDDELKELRNHG